MGALPEQEAGQPLLARGADDEIGIWLSLRIEVLGDVLRIDELGEFVERRALARVLLQQRPNRVDHLAPAPVADGNIHDRAIDIAGRSLGLLEQPRGVIGQEVECADGVNAPPCLRREVAHGVLDDADEGLELDGRPSEVIGREQPEGDDFDTCLVAPAEEVDDLRGAGPVAGRGGRTLRLGPAAVAVEDDANMPRTAIWRDLRRELSLVQPIHQIRKAHKSIGYPP